MADKRTLRKVYLEKRLTLTEDEYAHRNQLILDLLISHVDFTKYRHLHIFLAITDKKEVDTYQIIKKARKINPDIRVIVSKTAPQGELEHYLFDKSTKIEVNNWGIPEPVRGEPADLDIIDLVIVPLLTFDKIGHRIGYGKGYYDRFLKKVPTANKVGVSLSPPLDRILFSDDMDVKMDSCVTPFAIYRF